MAIKGDIRRRFEQWVSNPHCEANTISAVFNVPMRKVVKVEPHDSSDEMPFGQSPFALARGNMFERSLFRDNAKRLIDALHEVDQLEKVPTVQFWDCRQKGSGGGEARLKRCLTDTRRVLSEIIAGGVAKTHIIAGATILIPGRAMLPDSYLIIDALIIKPTRIENPHFEAIVVEVKTYTDRAGYTDGGSLAQARAQAGVYVYGLQVALQEWGIQAAYRVSNQGVLILTKPGSNRPAVRAGEDLKYQADRARLGFERLRSISQKYCALEDDKRQVDEDGTLREIVEAPIAYCESCLTFCDRAQICHRRLRDAGAAAILGDDVARFLGRVSMPRSFELMDGAAPQNEAESDFQSRYLNLMPRRSRA